MDEEPFEMRIYCTSCGAESPTIAAPCTCSLRHYMLQSNLIIKNYSLIACVYPESEDIFWHVYTAEEGRYVQAMMPANVMPVPRNTVNDLINVIIT